MSFFKFLLLISIITLSLQAAVNKNKERNETKSNVTETISDYFNNSSLMEGIVEKWNNFTNMFYNLFHIKPTKTGTKDIKQEVNEFNKKIAEYFKKNMPKENYTEMLTKFSDKVSEYITSAGEAKNETLDIFYDKLYDFSSNITDFFNQYNLTDTKANLKENFSSFLDKVGEYFKSNHTSLKEYITDYKTGKHLPHRTFPGDLFTYVIHYHEYYFYPADKRTTCNAEQIDRCNHLCREDKKVFCGCYIHKGVKNGKQNEKKVDCVCADNEMTCELKHVHKDASKEPKKDIL